MKKKLIALLLLLALFLTGCEFSGPAPVSGDGLTVHFIDVGQADAILLECGGEFMLIDGGNRDDGRMLVKYLQDQGVEELKAVVCTHAHEDHVGGLPSVLAVFPVGAVYAPTSTYSSKIFDDFVYYTDQQGLEIHRPPVGDVLSLGEANLTVLGPVMTYAETNDTSIVLRADYGSTSFLFTGDMESQAENDMLDAGAEVKADVLKVGHHGSNTSTSYRFLREVDPDYAVIQVGEGNTYGHPHEEPMSRLNQADVTVMRTDKLGTIRAFSDGTKITFTWENQKNVPDNAQPGEELTFIGNKNSKIFHTSDCASLPAEKNRVEFSSYEEAQEAGYKPCGNCLG